MSKHDSSADGRLFREAIGADCGQVRILPDSGARPSAPKPKPTAAMTIRDAHNACEELQRSADSATPIESARLWCRDGIPATTREKLAHGRFSARDELDLRGHSAASGLRLLAEFLRDSRSRGLGCIRLLVDLETHAGSVTPIEVSLEHRSDVVAFHVLDNGRGRSTVTVLLGRRRT